jgi:3,4-dihydroxy 2-butanone 4-phosphate synthase / GTP cyclohydrolase II
MKSIVDSVNRVFVENDSAVDKTSLSSLTTVELIAVAHLPIKHGEFEIAGYRSVISNEQFIVLFKGQGFADAPTLVRIHSQCLTGDVFGSIKCDCGAQLQRAIEMIEQEERGVLVYQMQEGRGIGILNKIRAYALQDQGADTVEANEQLRLGADLRDYYQCGEILKSMGLRRIRVATNNPRKLIGLEQAGLEVVERVPIEVQFHELATFYMRTKKRRLGHLLETID